MTDSEKLAALRILQDRDKARRPIKTENSNGSIRRVEIEAIGTSRGVKRERADDDEVAVVSTRPI